MLIHPPCPAELSNTFPGVPSPHRKTRSGQFPCGGTNPFSGNSPELRWDRRPHPPATPILNSLPQHLPALFSGQQAGAGPKKREPGRKKKRMQNPEGAKQTHFPCNASTLMEKTPTHPCLGSHPENKPEVFLTLPIGGWQSWAFRSGAEENGEEGSGCSGFGKTDPFSLQRLGKSGLRKENATGPDRIKETGAEREKRNGAIVTRQSHFCCNHSESLDSEWVCPGERMKGGRERGAIPSAWTGPCRWRSGTALGAAARNPPGAACPRRPGADSR